MTNTPHNIGVASRIGKYSDAVEAAPSLRWLHTSDTPGLARPAFLLLVVPQLIWPEVLVEVESSRRRPCNV